MLFMETASKARQSSLKKAGLFFAICLAAGGMAPDAHAVRTARSRPAPHREIVDGTSLLGSYLAGHVARSSRDSENAALYYRRALEKDPLNQDILDDAFLLELAAGDFKVAHNLALRLVKRQSDNSIAHIFLGVDAYKRGNFAAADEHFRVAQHGSSPDEPTIKLARAWVAVASGEPNKALSAMQAGQKTTWATHFEAVQRAFMADVAKKKAIALEAYRSVYDKKAQNARIAEAFARHLAYWGDPKQAQSVLEEGGGAEAPAGKCFSLTSRQVKPQGSWSLMPRKAWRNPFSGSVRCSRRTMASTPRRFISALHFSFSRNSDIGRLELAELYGNVEQYAKAIDVVAKIREGSPFWVNAQVRKALYLNALQKTDDAIALLTALSEKHSANQQILQTLAAIESARKKYEAAIPYYGRAIALLGTPEKKDWQLFYSRGIAYERTKQWAKAEPDFKKALELDPEQGAVLNYLGYSWLDQNMHIPEAFDLIKKAVRLRPNDGYIIDSLGWAYYLQKDYEQAVKHLDKAVELRPEDLTLNDHLGDVYWRLGRRLEAKFQWNQALTLNPEPEDAAKIKKKLEQGLPDDSGPRAALEAQPSAVQTGAPETERPPSGNP